MKPYFDTNQRYRTAANGDEAIHPTGNATRPG